MSEQQFSAVMQPAEPTRGPAGRGGIYSTGSAADIPERIVALTRALAEHPATRQYLPRGCLYYGTREDGTIALLCSACNERPCTCGTIDGRAREYMVQVYRDPVLRRLFDERRLAVRR